MPNMAHDTQLAQSQLMNATSKAAMCVCLQLLERTFTCSGSTALPEATFAAWSQLSEVLHACGQVGRRSQLLLNPITFAINSDKRCSVHQVLPAGLKQSSAHCSKTVMQAVLAFMTGLANCIILCSIGAYCPRYLTPSPPQFATTQGSVQTYMRLHLCTATMLFAELACQWGCMNNEMCQYPVSACIAAVTLHSAAQNSTQGTGSCSCRPVMHS